jgi:hypothetical protein
MLDSVGASTVATFWRLARREAVQLCLNLRDARQLDLEFVDDFGDLGREVLQFTVARWSGRSLRSLFGPFVPYVRVALVDQRLFEVSQPSAPTPE